jgi:hypothetical protein
MGTAAHSNGRLTAISTSADNDRWATHFRVFFVLNCAPKRICASAINSLLAQALVSEVEKAKGEKAGCTMS